MSLKLWVGVVKEGLTLSVRPEFLQAVTFQVTADSFAVGGWIVLGRDPEGFQQREQTAANVKI